MAMVSLDRLSNIRTGVIIAVDGIALVFLAVLFRAYAAGDVLPWRTSPEFVAVGRQYLLEWITSPALAFSNVLTYVGLGFLIVGLLWIAIGSLYVRFRSDRTLIGA